MTGDLQNARAAAGRRSWLEAYEALVQADSASPLGAEDLELYALTALMLARDDEAVAILERAHHRRLEGGESLPAAYDAIWIGLNLAYRGAVGPASGWLGRAQRLLDQEPDDCAHRGYLLLPNVFRLEAGGEYAEAGQLAEEAGADGLWISSFEVHTLARLPDADILGTEDVVEVIAKISDRVASPILVDGNAGGGNAINTIRLVREFEKAGASGICIEDNIYPKRCSFYGGMQEDLEQVSTFTGKIQAAVEKRVDPDFVVVARTEALIKGLGLDVALERGKAYADAGADAILIHHTQPDPTPVLEFAERWYRDETAPLVCVPTAYRTVTYEQLNDAGFKLIVFSHYPIRSVVKALQETYGSIMENKRLADADELVADMDEIFRLIYLDELRENEARYVR